MLVLIEVTVNEQMALFYAPGKRWQKTSALVLERSAALNVFARLFAEIAAPLRAITGIGLRVASERFTTIRLSATIANALAYALNVPVAAAPPRCTPEELKARLALAAPGQDILPEYKALPRLGPSR